MFIGNRKRRSIYDLCKRFSDGGAQPTADPVPADGAGANADTADGGILAADPTDIAAELAALKEQFEAEKQARTTAEKSRKAAEDALVNTKKELKKTEREKMSESELLAEREKELAAKEADLNRRMNFTAAKGILTDLGISDKDMSEDDLSLFVSSNEERTTNRCQWLKDFVKRREQAAAKSEREKVLKETPKPAAGDPDNGAVDPFVAAFKSSKY